MQVTITQEQGEDLEPAAYAAVKNIQRLGYDRVFVQTLDRDKPVLIVASEVEELPAAEAVSHIIDKLEKAA